MVRGVVCERAPVVAARVGSYRVRTGATAVGGRRPAAHRELPSAHGWPRQSAEGGQLPIGSYRVRMGAMRSRRVQPTTGARSHTTPLTMHLNPL